MNIGRDITNSGSGGGSGPNNPQEHHIMQQQQQLMASVGGPPAQLFGGLGGDTEGCGVGVSGAVNNPQLSSQGGAAGFEMQALQGSVPGSVLNIAAHQLGLISVPSFQQQQQQQQTSMALCAMKAAASSSAIATNQAAAPVIGKLAATSQERIEIGGALAGECEDRQSFKRKLRLEQNRLSAQRSRKRKKILIEELEKATRSLEDEYRQLEAENRALMAKFEERKNRVNAGTAKNSTGDYEPTNQIVNEAPAINATPQEEETDAVSPGGPSLQAQPNSLVSAGDVGRRPARRNSIVRPALSIAELNNVPVSKPFLQAQGMEKIDSFPLVDSLTAGNSGQDLFKMPFKAGGGKPEKVGPTKSINETGTTSEIALKTTGFDYSVKPLDQEQQPMPKQSRALRNISAQLASLTQQQHQHQPSASAVSSVPGSEAAAASTSIRQCGLAQTIAAQRQQAFLQAAQAQAQHMGRSQTQPLPGTLAWFRQRLMQHQMNMNMNRGGSNDQQGAP